MACDPKVAIRAAKREVFPNLPKTEVWRWTAKRFLHSLPRELGIFTVTSAMVSWWFADAVYHLAPGDRILAIVLVASTGLALGLAWAYRQARYDYLDSHTGFCAHHTRYSLASLWQYAATPHDPDFGPYHSIFRPKGTPIQAFYLHPLFVDYCRQPTVSISSAAQSYNSYFVPLNAALYGVADHGGIVDDGRLHGHVPLFALNRDHPRYNEWRHLLQELQDRLYEHLAPVYESSRHTTTSA